jgi:hypothetical protein
MKKDALSRFRLKYKTMTFFRVKKNFILLPDNHIGLRIVPFSNHAKDVIVGHVRIRRVCLMNVPSQRG